MESDYKSTPFKNNVNIASETKNVEKNGVGHLHYIIKQDENDDFYIIATNTSKTDSLFSNVFDVENKKNIAPLDV